MSKVKFSGNAWLHFRIESIQHSDKSRHPYSLAYRPDNWQSPRPLQIAFQQFQYVKAFPVLRDELMQSYWENFKAQYPMPTSTTFYYELIPEKIEYLDTFGVLQTYNF